MNMPTTLSTHIFSFLNMPAVGKVFLDRPPEPLLGQLTQPLVSIFSSTHSTLSFVWDGMAGTIMKNLIRYSF